TCPFRVRLHKMIVYQLNRRKTVPNPVCLSERSSRHAVCIAPFARRLTPEETSVNESPITPRPDKTSDTYHKIWADEEILGPVDRAGLTPWQQVEQKLIGILKSSPVLVSHVQRRLKPGPH